MGYNAADCAALVAAAVQAAIHGGAPRRTVAAVAAAVAGTVLSAAAAPRRPTTKPQVQPQDAQSAVLEADNPEQLLASLRAARRAQRQRKKQRRRDARQAANLPPPAENAQQHFAETTSAGTAGLSAEHVGAPAAAPAPVPHSPDAASAAGAATPEQPTGLTLQRPPMRPRVANEFYPELADLGISDAGSHTNKTVSDIAPSGEQRRDRSPRRFEPGKR